MGTLQCSCLIRVFVESGYTDTVSLKRSNFKVKMGFLDHFYRAGSLGERVVEVILKRLLVFLVRFLFLETFLL